MFLRATKRWKDGKEHRYWSVVESRRISGKKIVQKTLLYLGEINDYQQAKWNKSIEAFEGEESKQISLFTEKCEIAKDANENKIEVKINEIRLKNPRQWGACWLTCELWEKLQLGKFWEDRLKNSRKGTEWSKVLQTLVAYRFIDPGSEWRLHRQWYDHTAMADLLGTDFSVAEKDTLYRCLDKILPFKDELFSHLKKRWEDLFQAKYDVLLYDLTSTYFEVSQASGKKQFGHSKDKRSDCPQVVIALIVTTEGFPIAYEVMPGNTHEKSTLKDFLNKIEKQYGKARRTWVMDRGIPSDQILQEMNANGLQYVVGTPKGKLTKLEEGFLDKPWIKIRDSIKVKLTSNGNEAFILTQSKSRLWRDRDIRRFRFKRLIARLKELKEMKLSRDQLLFKIGAAKKEAGSLFKLVDIQIPKPLEKVTRETFSFKLNKQKFKVLIQKEGSYLLRSNITDRQPDDLWRIYVQLIEVEEAFKNLKGDLAIRPIFHSKNERIDAHIFVSFLSYCLHVTLKNKAKISAPGLTPRSILEQLKAIVMLDVELPTSDGRCLLMSRYTQPDKLQQLLLSQLGLTLPKQPPPKIYSIQ